MRNSKSIMRVLLSFVASLALFASCVPNKKVQVLQKDDVNKRDLPKDTMLRTYALDTFSYRVQPNDLLLIRFQSLDREIDPFRPTTTTNVQNSGGMAIAGDLVDEKGEISVPVIGKVRVAGLTVFQIQDTLQYLASQYVEAPTVKVRLMNFRITILGEVPRQGTITFNNNRVSMIEAISEAGGLGELGDGRNIKLIRQRGATTEVQYIDIMDENFFLSPYYYVHQNDILIVPPLLQRPYRKYFGPNMSLIFSSLSLVLFVINLMK